MLSSEQLKKITTEARPIIERQLEDAAKLAGLRDVVAAAGGDWGQLKALIKAQIKDENDEAGDGKHVRKLLDKADYALGYADMLGLGNLNEKNSFADGGDDQLAGLEALDPKLLHLLVEGSKTEAGLSLIRNALAVVQGGIEPSLRNPQTTEPAHSDPQGAAADAEGSDEPSLPSAIQSTAAGKDRQDSTEGDPAPVALDREAATTPPASESPPVDTPSTPDKTGEGGPSPAPVTSTQPQVDSGTVADEAAVSGESAGGENVDAAADSAGGRDSSPAVASNIIKIGSGKPLRPFCLHLDDLTKCGGYGKQHCGPCLKAHADAEGLTA